MSLPPTKLHDIFNKTPEEWEAWLKKFPDDPPGCLGCGLMAGCCKDYPNCPGNPAYKTVIDVSVGT